MVETVCVTRGAASAPRARKDSKPDLSRAAMLTYLWHTPPLLLICVAPLLHRTMKPLLAKG